MMDPHWRASHTPLPNYGENNGSIPLHPEPLLATPISCVPYTGPPLPDNYPASASPDINAGSVPVEVDTASSSTHIITHQPAMVFFTACPAKEEWDNLINRAKGGVALTGSALLGKFGQLIGSVDIHESEDDYVFRVSLPGVARDEKVFRCDVGPNGRIVIKGVIVTGENMVCRDNMVFKMQTHNLCPPGEFSVSFQLPGPIDHQHLKCVFGSDGIFEGVVKKKRQQ
ncbi:alpha-crystallin domain-containing protein 22.3 [Lycium barbarum]|uniref:alpha-crystallin domain-containing protein 22.3 n=1 Tax=Lycium barbarum TaxID=112863 RepID=UPI00293E8732|nr:alpha-crystallin domain-containing protein 22.3 [Lycium barbarum]